MSGKRLIDSLTLPPRSEDEDFLNFIGANGPEIPDFRIKTIEDLLRDNTIAQVDKTGVLKCFAFVMERYSMTGIEPINGNTCVTVDGVYHCIKIHHDQTIDHVKVMPGKRSDYMKFQMKGSE